jgi:hypothetical protein
MFFNPCVFLTLRGICLGPEIGKPFPLKHGIMTLLMQPIASGDGYKEDELCATEPAYWP